MKLSDTQLSAHLTQSLAPVYIVSSDETLLVEDTVALLHQTAQKSGFTEILRETIETGTDLQKLLYTETHTLSLFSNKKVLELHFKSKFLAAHGKIIEEYAKNPLPSVLLIIKTAKWDTKTEKTAWYQALEKITVLIPIRPIPLEQLPQWILNRAKKNQLILSQTACLQLATLVEGNLLAAAQEIEKLALLQLSEPLKESDLELTMTDLAHFDIFNLVDSILMGNLERSLRILQTLLASGTEPTLILWALTRELRLLSEIQQKRQQGSALTLLFNQFRIWEKRKAGVRLFLERHSETSMLQLFVIAAKIDRIIKGSEPGSLVDDLQTFILKMSGNGIITLE